MSTLQTDIDPDLEQKIRELGEALWAKAQGEVPSLFDKSYWQGRMMEWAMRDPGVQAGSLPFRRRPADPPKPGSGDAARARVPS